MGFDTSHHPVDPSIVARATDYIAGHGSIDDLVAEAVRLEKVRFRANAWGLGISRAKVPGFDSWLHVWGRPFFVTVEDDAQIGASIDRYLAARTDAEVDAIAADMLRVLDPSLPDRARPSTDGSLPGDADLAAGLRQSLDLLREAWKASERGGSVRVPSGDQVPASELLYREVPLAVLTFAAHFRPGWMDRGYVWPTALFAEAGVPAADLFESPRALLGKLAEHTSQRYFLETSITENYMVGGYVPAARVPALRARIEEHRERLEAQYDGPTPDMQRSVKKLLEAVRDAERRGLAFAEATEVYSGFSGIMN